MKNNKFKIALIDPVKGFNSTYIPTGLCYLSSFLKKYLGDMAALSLVMPENWIEPWKKEKPWENSPKTAKLK